MALHLARKAMALQPSSPVVQLYRSMSREVPKVLSIYDIDIPVNEARQLIRGHFTKNGHVKDSRVVDMLVAKGYMELEETLMQWKQKAQLMRVFEKTGVHHTTERLKSHPIPNTDGSETDEFMNEFFQSGDGVNVVNDIASKGNEGMTKEQMVAHILKQSA